MFDLNKVNDAVVAHNAHLSASVAAKVATASPVPLQQRVSTTTYAEQLPNSSGDQTTLGEKVAENFNLGYGTKPVAALNDARPNAPQYHTLAGVLETRDKIAAARAPKKAGK